MLFLNFIFVASLGFVLPNTTAVGLAPFHQRAGAAAALMGALQFVIGALASAIVSAFDNGTPIPMTGTMAVCGLTALVILLLATRRVAPMAALGVDK
jgi:DHA1 family bicyclomycin/chloramphenicol resistance-like MFS transporter